MNRLPLVTAALATLLAIGLWILATWLEDEARWQSLENPPADSQTPVPTTPAIDTPVQTLDADCETVEQELMSSIDAARSCETNTDCVVFDYGYPIDCMTSVSRSQISWLREEYRRYHESCEYRVYFDCPTGDARRRPVCRNQQCEIELVTVDELTDDTLDYLGIDP